MNSLKKVLPKPLKKIIIRFLDTYGKKLGYSRVNNYGVSHNKISLLETVYANIKTMGFFPKHIIDVGANHGNWTRETLNHFPDAFYTLLEPQNWLQPKFQDLLDKNDKISLHAVGAGAASGSFLFTLVNRDDSCTFRYTKEEADREGYKQIELPIITLNELVKSKTDIPFPDLVKIDAEGLDIEVLKGANTLFGKTEIFMVEASVNCKMLYNDVIKTINFMDQNGYVLFDITDLNRPFNPKLLWLVELVFVKKGGILDSYNLKVNL